MTISRAEYEQLQQEKAQMESTRVRLEAERIKLEAEHARLEAKLATIEQEQAQVIGTRKVFAQCLLQRFCLPLELIRIGAVSMSVCMICGIHLPATY